MKAFSKTIILLGALAVFSQPVFAGVSDFVEVIGDIASESSSRSSGSSRSVSSGRYYDSFGDWLLEQVFIGVCELWVLNNFLTRFEPYPYACDDRYINLDSTFKDETRSFRFSLDFQVSYQWNLGFVGEQHIEGFFFKFIGPYASNSTIIDSNGGLTGNTQLGGQLALVQSNPFSCYFFIDWVHWYGDASRALGSDGTCFGFTVRSYPFQPIVLDWKISWQEFDTNVSITDSQLEIGMMTGRRELYGGWRYTSLRDSSGRNKPTMYNGITLGQRVYF